MSTLDRQAVIQCLSRLVTPGIKFIALADELGARKHEYNALKKVIADLVEEGTAEQLPGGAYKLAPSGRPADRKTAPKPKEAREEYDPPDEPFANATVAKPKPGKLVAPKKSGALPWGKGSAKAATPPTPAKKAPRPVSGKTVYRGEYDPETGEIIPPGDVPAPATPEFPEDIAKDDRTIGRITVHPAGYGFVATEGGETVFVPAKYRGLSLDGDRVAVDTWPGHRGTEGRVTEVLARGRARLTGILRKVGRAVFLEPDDPRISSDYGRVHLDDAPQGKDGDAIVIEITRYPDAARKEIAGKLLKVLGDPDDPRTEIEKILVTAQIPMEFPEEALAQAAKTAQELGPNDLANRIDRLPRRPRG